MSILEGALTTLPLRVTYWLSLLGAELTGWVAPVFGLTGWAAGGTGPALFLGLDLLGMLIGKLILGIEGPAVYGIDFGAVFFHLTWTQRKTEGVLQLYPALQLASIPVSLDFEWSLAVLEPGSVKQWCVGHGNTLLCLPLFQYTDDIINIGVVTLDFPR